MKYRYCSFCQVILKKKKVKECTMWIREYNSHRTFFVCDSCIKKGVKVNG